MLMSSNVRNIMRVILILIIFVLSLVGMEEVEDIYSISNPIKIASRAANPEEYFDQIPKVTLMSHYNFVGFLDFVKNNNKHRFWREYLFDYVGGNDMEISCSKEFWLKLLKKLGYQDISVYHVIDLLDKTKRLLFDQQNNLATGFVEMASNDCNGALIKILAGSWGIKIKDVSQFTEQDWNNYARVKEISKGIGVTAFKNKITPQHLSNNVLDALRSSIPKNKHVDQYVLNGYYTRLYSKIAKGYLENDRNFVSNISIFSKNIPYDKKTVNGLLLSKRKQLILDFYNIIEYQQLIMEEIDSKKDFNSIPTVQGLWNYLKEFNLESLNIQGEVVLNLKLLYKALEEFSRAEIFTTSKEKKIKLLLKSLRCEGFFNNSRSTSNKNYVVNTGEPVRLFQELTSIFTQSVVTHDLMQNDPVYEKSFSEISEYIEDKKIENPYRFNPPENMSDILFCLFLKYMGNITNKYAYPLTSACVAMDAINGGEKISYLSRPYNNYDILTNEDIEYISRHITAKEETDKIKLAMYYIMDAFSLIPKNYDSSSFLANTTIMLENDNNIPIFHKDTKLYFSKELKERIDNDEDINKNFEQIMNYSKTVKDIYLSIKVESPIQIDQYILRSLYYGADLKWSEQIKAKENYLTALEEEDKESEKVEQLQKEVESMIELTKNTIPKIIDDLDTSLDFIQDAVDLEINPNIGPLIKCEYQKDIPDKSKKPALDYLFENTTELKTGIKNQIRAINYWMYKTKQNDQKWHRLLWLLIYRNQSY